jgi:hypothetical protein
MQYEGLRALWGGMGFCDEPRYGRGRDLRRPRLRMGPLRGGSGAAIIVIATVGGAERCRLRLSGLRIVTMVRFAHATGRRAGSSHESSRGKTASGREQQ